MHTSWACDRKIGVDPSAIEERELVQLSGNVGLIWLNW